MLHDNFTTDVVNEGFPFSAHSDLGLMLHDNFTTDVVRGRRLDRPEIGTP